MANGRHPDCGNDIAFPAPAEIQLRSKVDCPCDRSGLSGGAHRRRSRSNRSSIVIRSSSLSWPGCHLGCWCCRSNRPPGHRPCQRRTRNELAKRTPPDRSGGVGVRGNHLLISLLGARRRRSRGARTVDTGVPRLGISRTSQPSCHPSGMAARVLRLPVPWLHGFDRVQSYRCDAACSLGQTRYGNPGGGLTRHLGTRDRASSQHLQVADSDLPIAESRFE